MKHLPNYLIIGNGKMAKHVRHYFSISNISFDHWYRSGEISLENLIEYSDIILILISDEKIENFYKQYLASSGKLSVHFSGSLVVDEVTSVHPLMTFGPELYEDELYEKIPFVVEKGNHKFKDLFPGLNNPNYEISKEKKALYHAKCVMASNFSVLLWDSFFKYMENEIGMGPEVASIIMDETIKNIKKLGPSALTGPLERGDMGTTQKNILSLEETGESELFKEFAKTYFPKLKGEACLQ